MKSDLPRSPVVFVTGFGPFGRHNVNASWEAVKLLPALDLEKELGVQLVIDQVPVRYEYVADYLCKKWAELKPHVSETNIGRVSPSGYLCAQNQPFTRYVRSKITIVCNLLYTPSNHFEQNRSELNRQK
jgi:hypothetical protein